MYVTYFSIVVCSKNDFQSKFSDVVKYLTVSCQLLIHNILETFPLGCIGFSVEVQQHKSTPAILSSDLLYQ